MADLIRHKRTSTPGTSPTTGDLQLGELGINTNDGKLFIKKDNGVESIVEFREPRSSFKSITIESPTSSEDITLFRVPYDITIIRINTTLRGSTPSVTYTLRYASDRSSTGTEVITGGSITTNTSTGDSLSSFDNAGISSQSIVWVETTAMSGTVDEFNLTIEYTVD